MVKKMTPIEEIKKCLDNGHNFVLQGGAGSGKTQTLNDVVKYLSQKHPDKRVACITHTNLAAIEIRNRIGDVGYTISTIHSFLLKLIKNYKKNMQIVLPEIFYVPEMMRDEFDEKKQPETEYKKEEHNKYKKTYKKYVKLKYIVTGESDEKVLGKKAYDNNPDEYNSILNVKIKDLNLRVENLIKERDYKEIEYNETKFDSLLELSFGHDSLLKIAALLITNYPLLRKIIRDKYDYILIDEFQDTNEEIIQCMINLVGDDEKTGIGLFGDSMQSIYEDGISNVENYISSGKLKKIQKEDNFRCSPPVIELINRLRTDGLVQKLELANKDGKTESLLDRNGSVKLLYSVYPDKPRTRSSKEKKEIYEKALDKLVEMGKKQLPNSKILMLTNKSISSKGKFGNLFEVFNEMYSDTIEQIEKHLTRLQAFELVEMCLAYSNKDYNSIYKRLKYLGLSIESVKDKVALAEKFKKLTDGKLSLLEALNFSFDGKILKKSDSFLAYLERKELFLSDISNDKSYQAFKVLYQSGKNTFARMSKETNDFDEEDFNELERDYKREIFYQKIFSDEILFSEVVKCFEYLDEKLNYITMHKTKGASIDNVIIVLDEYFWNEYKFKSIFEANQDINSKVTFRTLKLFYVACSRAKYNLLCIRILKDKSEEPELFSCLKDNVEVPVSDLI